MVLWLICLILGSSIVLMRYCPNTAMAVALRRYLAVEPARWLAERKRSDLFYFLIVAGLFTAGGEVFAVLGPEVVLLYAADLAFYLDLVIVVSLAAATSRLKLTLGAVRSHASSAGQRICRAMRRNVRETRTRRKREVIPSDNDDEDSWLALREAA